MNEANESTENQTLVESNHSGLWHVGQSDEDNTEERVATFLERVLPVISCSGEPISALIPWVCDVLFSENSLKAYGRDLADFVRHMELRGVAPSAVTADHVKIYKAALIRAGVRATTIARRLSVIRGAYHQFAEKGLVGWPTAQAVAAVKAPPVQKNTTPALTNEQAGALLRAVPTDTLQGLRDLAMLHTVFITACRVSAIVSARVGDLEFDGNEHYLHVREKRGKETRKILLDAAKSLNRYLDAAKIREDEKRPLFRPMSPNGKSLVARQMDRKTPWRIVKKYCRLAGIEHSRLSGRGVGIHSLRKTAITEAIRNGAGMHEVRELAGHSDIRTTELYYARSGDDGSRAARRIRIRPDHCGS